ncbi:MAG: hypothetical protein QF464_15650, partial [Myxococcota bacterium]|nr:hypothetical protein [Myxococcota bacterium]
DALSVSADALARAQEQGASTESSVGMDRAGLVQEELAQAARDGAEERLLREMVGRAEAARQLGAEGDERPTTSAEQRPSVDSARVATPSAERAAAEQTSEASVTMGQQGLEDDDLIEEAANDAFDQAQAAREGGEASQPSDGRVTVAQTAAQIVAAMTPTTSADPVATEAIGATTTSSTIMEEVLMAQRGAAGGDRVGDADAIIRIPDSAAGALQVKVKRQGDDLSLRVRAEDLAMRNVMAESLPELKHELQKANLVDGQIEIQEDGVEDQMQSEFAWDGDHSDGQNAQGDVQQDAAPSQTSTATTSTSTPTRGADHDGQLHVVA